MKQPVKNKTIKISVLGLFRIEGTQLTAKETLLMIILCMVFVLLLLLLLKHFETPFLGGKTIANKINLVLEQFFTRSP